MDAKQKQHLAPDRRLDGCRLPDGALSPHQYDAVRSSARDPASAAASAPAVVASDAATCSTGSSSNCPFTSSNCHERAAVSRPFSTDTIMYEKAGKARSASYAEGRAG